MFGQFPSKVRAARPLIHCMTNYVTANDCANLLLACGASPIMAEDPDEVCDVVSLSRGLCLNLGTLDRSKAEAMLIAGMRANECAIPVVLDPVGAGVSRSRTRAAQTLLERVRFAVVRANASEIRSILRGGGRRTGVDADASDAVTEESLDARIELAKEFARQTGAVCTMTGAIDVVTDGVRTFCIRNGHPMMAAVTGTGCQLSALTAAYAAVDRDNALEAAAAAACAMGLAGQTAHARLSPLDGNATYRNYMIDAIFHMTPQMLEEGAEYEVR